MIDEFIFIRTSRLNGFFGTNFLTIKEYYFYFLKIVTSLQKLVFVFGIVTGFYTLLNKNKTKNELIYYCLVLLTKNNTLWLYSFFHKNFFCKTDITI